MTCDEMNYKLSGINPVKMFMERNELTQKQMAGRLKCSVGAVSQWLAGKRKIPGPVLAYIELSWQLKSSRETVDMLRSKLYGTY